MTLEEHCPMPADFSFHLLMGLSPCSLFFSSLVAFSEPTRHVPMSRPLHLSHTRTLCPGILVVFWRSFSSLPRYHLLRYSIFSLTTQFKISTPSSQHSLFPFPAFFFPSQALSPYNEWSNLPIYLCAVFLSWLDYEPHRVAGILSISLSRLHHPEQCLVLSRCSIKIFVEEKLEGRLREERIEWQVRIILLYNRFSHFGMKITSHVQTASLLYNLLAASLIPCVILKAFSTLVSFILISSIILRLFSCVRASGDRH